MDLTQALQRAAAERGLVRVTPGTARDPGFRRALRRGDLRQVRRGVYSHSPSVLAEEAVVAALLVAPPGSMACDITAARLWRMDALPSFIRAEPIHLWLPQGERRTLAGCRLHHAARGAAELPCGVPSVCRRWTLVDLAASLSFDDAVVAAESAFHAEPELLVGVGALRTAGLDRRAAKRIAAVFDFARSLSESALETRARLLFAAAGLPSPIQQAVVRRRGRFLARVDFLWPEALLVVEVDGMDKYAERGELQREKQRQNDLVAEGYVVLRFTWGDVMHRRDMVVQRVARSLGFR